MYKRMTMLILWRRRAQGWKLSQEAKTIWCQDQKRENSEKQRCPTTIGTVQLENSIPQQQSSSSLSAQPACCFTIPLSFGPQKLKTLALLDSEAFVYFLDKKFAKCHKICLEQKSKSDHVEVIDGRPLSSGSVTHKSEPIEVTFKDHSSYIIFNIIKIPSNLIILGLSWLEKHNLSIDWRLRTMTFSIGHSKNNHVRKSGTKKSLFIGARAFV